MTPCHAIALGGAVPGFSNLKGIHNPFTGAYLCIKGLWNIISYHFYDSHCRRRCLEYLVQYGGNINEPTSHDETTKDIAKKRRKESLVYMINEYCKIVWMI